MSSLDNIIKNLEVEIEVVEKLVDFTDLYFQRLKRVRSQILSK